MISGFGNIKSSTSYHYVGLKMFKKISNAVFLLFQYIAPKTLISRLAGKLASAKMGKFTTSFIKFFVKHYQVDLSMAEKTNPEDYATFNEFFTRALKPEARPVNNDENTLVFPADGTISQFGAIEQGRIIQAKGFDFSANTLLGGDRSVSELFREGKFITIYLSPKDYHRVHMPFTGQLLKMIFIPGMLYSVNPLTASNIDSLFARNERVVCLFKTSFGPMAVTLVGATIVASIETVWAGVVAPAINGDKTAVYDYSSQNIVLEKGAELGRFLLGSTVICCFPKNTMEFDDSLKKLLPTQCGQTMGTLNSKQ